MEGKHTLGNWTFENVLGRLIVTQGPKGFVIAEVTNHSISHFIEHKEEPLAKAKLLAAAPDLLKALKDLYSFTLNPEGRYLDTLLNECEAAINKATE